jgi:dTDP-4-dehydrorhamnose reductase
MRVTITGANGMLGHALRETVPSGVSCSGVDLADGDLTTIEGARQALEPSRPQVVIHCAAWTDVDGCTRDPERAMLQNATATGNVATVCRDLGARLVAISTDYVFDGTKGEPYTEEDATNPLNPYGRSKLAGELAIRETLPGHLIVRTEWLYGPHGRNFVTTIVTKGRELGALRVVADQFGSPTYTLDLARALWEVAPGGVRGILHLTNSGWCSWADLSREALRAAGLGHVTVEGIPAAEWPSPTARPQFSVLAGDRWRSLGHVPLRCWSEAAREYAQGLAEA